MSIRINGRIILWIYSELKLFTFTKIKIMIWFSELIRNITRFHFRPTLSSVRASFSLHTQAWPRPTSRGCWRRFSIAASARGGGTWTAATGAWARASSSPSLWSPPSVWTRWLSTRGKKFLYQVTATSIPWQTRGRRPASCTPSSAFPSPSSSSRPLSRGSWRQPSSSCHPSSGCVRTWTPSGLKKHYFLLFLFPWDQAAHYIQLKFTSAGSLDPLGSDGLHVPPALHPGADHPVLDPGAWLVISGWCLLCVYLPDHHWSWWLHPWR